MQEAYNSVAHKQHQETYKGVRDKDPEEIQKFLQTNRTYYWQIMVKDLGQKTEEVPPWLYSRRVGDGE